MRRKEFCLYLDYHSANAVCYEGVPCHVHLIHFNFLKSRLVVHFLDVCLCGQLACFD